ncbi:hypothetical protein HHI36_017162, partial [Cryptolaemus montrouzieri]
SNSENREESKKTKITQYNKSIFNKLMYEEDRKEYINETNPAQFVAVGLTYVTKVLGKSFLIFSSRNSWKIWLP